MIPQLDMNRSPPLPSNTTICVDGRQWDVSNLLSSHDRTISNDYYYSARTSHTASHHPRSNQHHHSSPREESSLQSPEEEDDNNHDDHPNDNDDVKVRAKELNNLPDEDEKDYEKEYYFCDDEVFLYPRDLPGTTTIPPTVDEIFGRTPPSPPQRRNIAEFDIFPSIGSTRSSHSNRSFAITRSSNEDDDDDDCSTLTFCDDASLHSQTIPVAPPQSSSPAPVFTPAKPRPMVEVMPNQFLSLRGSEETLFYIGHGFCREARCLYCSTNQYFIQDVTLVMCPGCRLIFAPESFGHAATNTMTSNTNNNCVGSLGLGLKVEEADAIFRQQQQRQQHQAPSPVQQLRRSRSGASSGAGGGGGGGGASGGGGMVGLQKSFSQASLEVAAAANHHNITTNSSHQHQHDKGSSSAAAVTATARNLLMRRQASLSRFRGSQHSKRSIISEASRAA